jgi:hypothetical protein
MHTQMLWSEWLPHTPHARLCHLVPAVRMACTPWTSHQLNHPLLPRSLAVVCLPCFRHLFPPWLPALRPLFDPRPWASLSLSLATHLLIKQCQLVVSPNELRAQDVPLVQDSVELFLLAHALSVSLWRRQYGSAQQVMPTGRQGTFGLAAQHNQHGSHHAGLVGRFNERHVHAHGHDGGALPR